LNDNSKSFVIIIIIILLPMMLLLVLFYYDRHYSHETMIKESERAMADILLSDEAFLNERMQSTPVILFDDDDLWEKKFFQGNNKRLERIILALAIENPDYKSVGMYSLERNSIVFHFGEREIYHGINNGDMLDFKEDVRKESFYSKMGDKIYYVVPLFQEGQIKGYIYSVCAHQVFLPYLFWFELLFAIGLAIFSAIWVELRTRQRIQTLKKEVDTLKNRKKFLPIYDDSFADIAHSVNDLKRHLINEQERLYSILDGLPIGIIFYDSSGQVTYVNKTAFNITGFTIEEIKKFTVSGNILNSYEHVFWETLRSGQSFLGFESYCPTKEGKEIPVVTSTKALYNSSNEFIGIISSFLDISEQERLRKVEQHAQVMLDHISDGVITVDNQGVINGFNRGAEEMTGLHADEVIGKKYDDIFIKRKTIFTKLTQTLKTGQEYSNYRKANITEDGRKIYLMITTRILKNEQGRQIGAMGIYKDITPLEEFEQKIQRADKLAAVGELAAGTAHEIRNPLTTIHGFLQILGKELKHTEKKYYVDLMLKEINHINEIIKEMLLLAKPAFPHKELISIQQMLEEIAPFMQSEGALHSIAFQVHIEEDLPVVEVDERQIKQVFMNIIRNGIQSMKKGGQISIIARYVEENQMVEVKFIDQGEGIPQSKLAKIYEPFYTTKEDGTALGIPVSYRIMKNHDGELQIESSEGKGTTVTLFFPVSTDESSKDRKE